MKRTENKDLYQGCKYMARQGHFCGPLTDLIMIIVLGVPQRRKTRTSKMPLVTGLNGQRGWLPLDGNARHTSAKI